MIRGPEGIQPVSEERLECYTRVSEAILRSVERQPNPDEPFIGTLTYIELAEAIANRTEVGMDELNVICRYAESKGDPTGEGWAQWLETGTLPEAYQTNS